MKSNNQKQTIELTKKQFIALLKVVYLGNWMANANRAKNMKKEHEGIEDYIFSLAPKFGLEKYMDHEASDGERYYPTGEFEENTDVHVLHDEYDEETFWDEMAERLGERDFFERYSLKEQKKMTKDERFTKLYECIDLYYDEFEKSGIKRIRMRRTE